MAKWQQERGDADIRMLTSGKMNWSIGDKLLGGEILGIAPGRSLRIGYQLQSSSLHKVFQLQTIPR